MDQKFVQCNVLQGRNWLMLWALFNSIKYLPYNKHFLQVSNQNVFAKFSRKCDISWENCLFLDFIPEMFFFQKMVQISKVVKTVKTTPKIIQNRFLADAVSSLTSTMSLFPKNEWNRVHGCSRKSSFSKNLMRYFWRLLLRFLLSNSIDTM